VGNNNLLCQGRIKPRTNVIEMDGGHQQFQHCQAQSGGDKKEKNKWTLKKRKLSWQAKGKTENRKREEGKWTQTGGRRASQIKRERRDAEIRQKRQPSSRHQGREGRLEEIRQLPKQIGTQSIDGQGHLVPGSIHLTRFAREGKIVLSSVFKMGGERGPEMYISR